MRPLALLLSALLAVAALGRAEARIQPEIVCLDPDIEFPVACDSDED